MNAGDMTDEPNSTEEVKARLELRNLELEAEKTRLEIQQLKQPFIFRNPQLATAIVTTLGALVGAYILASQNYFQAVRERLDRMKMQAEESLATAEQKQRTAQTLEREAAEKTQSARQAIADADDARRRAAQQTQDAEKRAAAQIAAANALVSEASTRARAAARDADLLSMDKWSIPLYVYEQQAQLKGINLYTGYPETRQAITSLSWLSAPRLTELSIAVSAERLSSVLAAVPKTVTSFTVAIADKVDVVDLSSLAPRYTLTSLSLVLSSRSFEERNRSTRIIGLNEFRRLQSLAVAASNPVIGIEAAAALPSLRQVLFGGQYDWHGAGVTGTFAGFKDDTEEGPDSLRLDLNDGGADNVPAIGPVMPNVKKLVLNGDPRGAQKALSRFPNATDIQLRVGPLEDSSYQEAREALTTMFRELEGRSNMRALEVMCLEVDGRFTRFSACEGLTLDLSRMRLLERLTLRGSEHGLKVKGISELVSLRAIELDPDALADTDLSPLSSLETLTLSSQPAPQLLESAARVKSLRSVCIEPGRRDVPEPLRQMQPAFQSLLDAGHIDRLRLVYPLPPIARLPASVRYVEFRDSCRDLKFYRSITRDIS